MKDLKELMLGSAKIDDKGIEFLSASITHLKLDDCQYVKDEGIASLAMHKNLKFLVLRRCYQISYETIKNLPTTMKVEWEEPPLSMALASKTRK
jgi:hypothetical protein